MPDFLMWLAEQDEARLAALFRRRPEVLRGPPPRDLAAVESRLTHPYAVSATVLRQPRPALDVLSALLAAEGPVPVSHLVTVLDDARSDDHEHQVRDWLGHLEESGLAWVDAADTAHAAPVVDEVLPVPTAWGRPARALAEALPQYVLLTTLHAWGIPPAKTKAATVAALAAAFADPDRVAAQLQRLTPRHRELLASDDGGSGRSYDPHLYTEWADAHRAGLAAGVLLAPNVYSSIEGEAPAEVLAALRGRGLPFDPVPPPLLTAAVDPDLVERESTAALGQFNEASLTVLDHVRDRPLKQLQRGGVGAQEVTRVAKSTTVDADMVRLVLDAAFEAGLLTTDGPTLRWGEAAAAWRDRDPGDRVAILLTRWLRTPRAPTQARDSAGRPLAVGAPERRCHACVDGRAAVLVEWARLDGVPHEAALAARVAWDRPLAHTAHRELQPAADPWDTGWPRRRGARDAEPAPLAPGGAVPDLGTVAAEARLLGLVAGGAPTTLLRALLHQDPAALASVADAMLPRATGTATFGSDLTAVVVGPPTGEPRSALLDACATRESRGGAVTWRFTPASVRRALDAGTTAARLCERLTGVATSGLPQPLTYLLADLGRRHGELRVATAKAVIRCDDEALLAQVVVDRALRALDLRQVAPTIAVSAVGDADTVTALRAAGYLPMPETPHPPVGSAPGHPTPAPATRSDNVVQLTRRPPVTTPTPTPTPARAPAPAPAPAPTPTQEEPAAAAARLVGVVTAPFSLHVDPQTAAAIRRVNRALSEREVGTLAQAVLDGGPVRIRYRSAGATVTDRIVSDLELSGPLVAGWCHLRDDERMFRISEILSVSEV